MIRKVINISLIILISGIPAFARKSSRIIPKQPDKIYLGAIVTKKSINSPELEIIDVKLPKEDIILPLSWGGYVKKTELSKENTTRIIKEKLTEFPPLKQGELFNGGYISLNNNYHVLYNSFGQTFDMKYYLSVEEYTPLTKNTKALKISNVNFSIYVGCPTQYDNFLEPAEIERLDKMGLKLDDIVYVSTIGFGKELRLIIESDAPAIDLKIMITHALRGEKLTKKEKYILDNSTITTMLIGEQKLPEVPEGNIFDRINKYFSTPLTADNFGSPICVNFGELKIRKTYQNPF